MLQNGQTEPSEAWVTRRRTMVRREVKFVRSKKASNQRKINVIEIFLPLSFKFIIKQTHI